MPCTVALHCDVPETATDAGVHVTVTEVMVLGAACTVTVAAPDLVGSCALVAVTVTAAGVEGAVNTPLAVIAPALADQATAEL